MGEKGMKIVVTGALGHIGSKLIRTLSEHFPGAEIILIDNLLTQRYCSLFHLPETARYLFLEADVLHDDLGPFIADATVVIHLAAITTPSSSYKNKDEVEEVNRVGTERVARVCSQLGVPLIFLSTTSVYDLQEGIVDEEVSLEKLHPASPYSQSKLCSEKMLQRFSATNGLRYTVLRLGTIFGVSPGMRFHTAVNKFVWQACNRVHLSVWRTALYQQRPYLDLNDAVRAMCFIIKEKCYQNKLYNVVTLSTTVAEIIRTVSNYINDLQIEMVDDVRMNDLSYSVQCNKIESMGFVFNGNLDAAVKDTVGLLRGLDLHGST